MELSGRIYFIHFSTIHQRNEIRPVKHFISLILLRNRALCRALVMLLLTCSCTFCTCEFFLAAVPNTLLQIFELMFHLLILPLSLLTLSPEQMPKERKRTHHMC